MSAKLSDIKRSISKHHEEDVTHQLYTVWGEAIMEKEEQERGEDLLQEYPRPYLRRESYRSLNGFWTYAFAPGGALPEEDARIHFWQGEILVPFSPESVLSQVGRQLLPGETLWYGRELPEDFAAGTQGHLLLHFGAVDFACCVYVNGRKCACLENGGRLYAGDYTHSGGYTPFTLDITDCLADAGNYVTLAVLDDTDASFHNRGKQSLKRGGMFYTGQSGIWQSVWMEWVPEIYIKDLALAPEFDRGQVRIHVELGGAANSAAGQPVRENSTDDGDSALRLRFLCEGTETAFLWPVGESAADFIYSVKELHPWTPETPRLYDCRLVLESDDGSAACTDTVESLFGMRCFTVEKDSAGYPRFCLNHEPYFLNGLLDQGYWPDGLYTAPSDEALVHDIQTMKNFGYNMLRKHAKAEPQRWYYHCDRLGMIVWQDMVNGGERMNMLLVCYLPTAFPVIGRLLPDRWHRLLHRKSEAGRMEWYQETEEMEKALKNVVSLAAWTLFNEGWGQFDSRKATGWLKGKDTLHLIDSASGWFDRGAGDFLSEHNYFHKLKPRRDKRGRAFVLSEYGGYVCHIDGHSFSDRIYGYRTYDDLPAFNAAMDALDGQIRTLAPQGLSAAVYTQVSDVEEEVNGILTYDRKVCKRDMTAAR